MINSLKPLRWVSSSLCDLKKFPKPVQKVMGFALDQAQRGGKSISAKPLIGFRGSGVLEVVDDYDGNTYRGVYTVRFAGVVYALHSFQKKSKGGIATPKQEIELIKNRLKLAELDYLDWKNFKGRPKNE